MSFWYLSGREGSDEPVHTHRFGRVFASHIQSSVGFCADAISTKYLLSWPIYKTSCS